MMGWAAGARLAAQGSSKETLAFIQVRKLVWRRVYDTGGDNELNSGYTFMVESISFVDNDVEGLEKDRRGERGKVSHR